MGGVCKVGGNDGPVCTDNFQVLRLKFDYAGLQWWSAEQAYQASKFKVKSKSHTTIYRSSPAPSQTDWDYGVCVWRIGQEAPPVHGWEDIKLRTMLLVNIAKFESSARLQQELTDTGQEKIAGVPSTWEWKKYNGQIMMLIRDRIRSETLYSLAAKVMLMDHDQVVKLLKSQG